MVNVFINCMYCLGISISKKILFFYINVQFSLLLQTMFFNNPCFLIELFFSPIPYLVFLYHVILTLNIWFEIFTQKLCEIYACIQKEI